jgi:transposase
MSKRGKAIDPEQKAAILKQHLLEDIPVSDLCDRYDISPSAFYRWQQELFDNASSCFTGNQGSRKKSAETARIAALELKLKRKEAKLSQKDEVLAELMEDHVKLKKSLLDD